MPLFSISPTQFAVSSCCNSKYILFAGTATVFDIEVMAGPPASSLPAAAVDEAAKVTGISSDAATTELSTQDVAKVEVMAGQRETTRAEHKPSGGKCKEEGSPAAVVKGMCCLPCCIEPSTLRPLPFFGQVCRVELIDLQRVEADTDT